MTEPGPDGVLIQIKQYRFVRELGRGGMGTVYEALDSRDGGRVAVKLLHPWLAAQDPSFRDRFEREAHIAALLRSPYSVRLLDFGAVDGTYFLVMEFVEGTNLSHELAQGPLDPVRALRIGIDVARALEEAAARGVVHRDIKPDNIMLTLDGRVKLTDFGIARQAGGAGLTSAGAFVGTPAYAAPEQAVGEADQRSDIYSLGATLYCMLTGQPPFTGGSAYEIMRQHQSSEVPMEPLAGLPNAITFPLRRCLEKDPRDRYPTAAELAGALERGLASYLRSGPTSPAARPVRPDIGTASTGSVLRPEAASTPEPVPVPAEPSVSPAATYIEPRQVAADARSVADVQPSVAPAPRPAPPPPPPPAADTRVAQVAMMASPAIPAPHSESAGVQPSPANPIGAAASPQGWLRRNWWKGFAFPLFLHGIPPLVVAIRDRNIWYGALAIFYSAPFFFFAAAATDSVAQNLWFSVWFLTFGLAILQVFVLPAHVPAGTPPWILEVKRLAGLRWPLKAATGAWIALIVIFMIAAVVGSGGSGS